MEVALVIIGTELLSGETLDTNSQYIGRALSNAGIGVNFKVTIPDIAENIKNALDMAFAQSSVVIMTGGLGPTKDDITKNLIAAYFGSEMKFRPEVFEHIQELLKHRLPNLSLLIRDQAVIPECARVLVNRLGTAPGLLVEQEGRVLIAMPGVHYEAVGLTDHEVIPYLKKLMQGESFVSRNLKLVGIPESYIANEIKDIEESLPEHIKLAYLPHLGQVKLRLTAKGNNETQLKQEIDIILEKIKSRVEKNVYGYDDTELPMAIALLLKDRKATLSIAESCTGGYLSHMITTVPGSSEYFKGSMVAYENEIKTGLLGVNEEIISQFGAVSMENAEAMAMQVRLKFKTDFGLATTGIAGPTGGTAEKPVGTLWMAASSEDKVISHKIVFDRGRIQNIQFFSVYALDLLRRLLCGISY
jgi:nicotinamide-nucleotide amidase